MKIYRVIGVDLDGYVTRCDKMFTDLKLAKQCFIECVKEGDCYDVTLTELGDVNGEIKVKETLNEGNEEYYTLAELKGNHGRDFIYKSFENDKVSYIYALFTGRWSDYLRFDTYEEALAATNGLPIVKQYAEEW